MPLAPKIAQENAACSLKMQKNATCSLKMPLAPNVNTPVISCVSVLIQLDGK